MTELLDCPCCGGLASIDGYKEHYSAGCEDCGLQTTYRESEAATAKAWNNRANRPSALPIPAPDPIYDARCALQDRTDWS
jgi:hypothetical protein